MTRVDKEEDAIEKCSMLKIDSILSLYVGHPRMIFVQESGKRQLVEREMVERQLGTVIWSNSQLVATIIGRNNNWSNKTNCVTFEFIAKKNKVLYREKIDRITN